MRLSHAPGDLARYSGVMAPQRYGHASDGGCRRDSSDENCFGPTQRRGLRAQRGRPCSSSHPRCRRARRSPGGGRWRAASGRTSGRGARRRRRAGARSGHRGSDERAKVDDDVSLERHGQR
jgi:hypothetical protein